MNNFDMSERKQSAVGMETKRKSNTDDDLPDQSVKDDLLPEWLLLEILTRLPIKSVFMFKCVSNRWNLFISHPFFAQVYLSHRNRDRDRGGRRMNWTILYQDTSDESNYLKDYFSPDQIKLDRLCYDDYDSPGFSVLELLDQELFNFIVASSNGLLLCIDTHSSHHRFRIYYVCNPITKQFVILPRHHTAVKGFNSSVSEGFVTRCEFGGAIVTSFKVVRLLYLNYSCDVVNMEIFDSVTWQWTTCKVNCTQSIKFDRYTPPSSLKGILHWSANHSSEIMAYDPYNNNNSNIDSECECCRLIKLPSSTGNRSKSENHLYCGMFGVCLGRLQYIEMLSGRFQVWVLEDYDAGKWHLKHCIGYHEISMDNQCFTECSLLPLAFHPFDSDAVYFFCWHKSVSSYNMQTKTFAFLFTIEPFYYEKMLSPLLFAPFVLPFWPPAVPQPLMGSLKLL